jgi:hypothetical protein
MVIGCEEVWREISNYLEDDVNPRLSAALEEHFRGCQRCTAVLEGTRNVVQLYGDERMVEVPLGFSYRLQRRLEGDMPGSRRRFLGWMVAAAAAVLVAGSFEMLRSSVSSHPRLRSEHARQATSIPPNMPVVVSAQGKVFHAPGCTFIHDPATARTIPVREAIQAGYTPCVRCMKEYLHQA